MLKRKPRILPNTLSTKEIRKEQDSIAKNLAPISTKTITSAG